MRILWKLLSGLVVSLVVCMPGWLRAADMLPIFDAHVHYSEEAWQRMPPKEAIALLRENVQRSPRFVASQVSLAETLEAEGDAVGAAQAYRQVLQSAPNYVGARLALARLLLSAGDLAGAAEQAQQSGDANAIGLELLGDVRTKQSLAADARTAYQAALALKPERAERKRIEAKLKAVR